MRTIVLRSIALIGAAILWALSLPGLDMRQMNDLGLVSVLPPVYFAALALLSASFALAVNSRKTPGWLLFLHVVLLILIIHGTPALTYETLRYGWAWNHVGVTDYILKFGRVDPNITYESGLKIYHNWPGFFALGALFTAAPGFTSALQVAGLAPVFFNLIDIGPLLLISGAFVRDQRLKWLAVWFFFLGNWIGQDYFSPQAMSYYLYLVIIGICLTWFGARPRPYLRIPGSEGAAGRLEGWWNWLSGPGGADDEPSRASTPPRRMGLMAMVILAFGAMASSHQLTPFVTLIAVGLLVVACRCSARSLPILMAVIALTWVMYGAWSWVGENVPWVLQTFGQLGENSALRNPSLRSDGQVVIARTALGMSILLYVLGAAGLGRRWRNARRDLPYLLVAGAPIPMMFATSYGGEMTLRVYLFTLPYVAFFAAALLYPTMESGRSRLTSVAVFVVSIVLVAGLLFAYFGRERMNYFTQDEVDAMSYLYAVAPTGSLVVGEDFTDFPTHFENAERLNHRSLTSFQGVRTDPLGTLIDVMGDSRYAASFMIISRSQRIMIEMNNLLPPGNVDLIEELLKQSGRFQSIYKNRDAEIFTLARQPGAAR